ncbi:MAG: COPII coat GTPase [Watsoniomyces obsoletus]|nr:MAG: COPII coat GTPase [Watsoniomyces obsoletus]
MSLAPLYIPTCVTTMDSGDGQVFIRNLAHFVRTHERALANALQLRRQPPKQGSSGSGLKEASSSSTSTSSSPATTTSSVSSLLAAALSLGTLNFASHQVKPAKLSLTPHHLFYLLSRFEELGVAVGPMNVRLESIHTDSSTANYVSFLGQSQRPRGRESDRDSIHSISSLRSVVSGVSSLWTNLGLGPAGNAARLDKAKAALQADLKYLYSAFTKIPCLRLAPDRKAGLIKGFEEFPFDTAVPLWAFKNVSALEISDVDVRQFFGWDRLAEQLRSLTVKRANLDDPADLLINIVLDDMDRRRRRSSRTQPSPMLGWTASTPSLMQPDMARSTSAPGSPQADGKLLGPSGSPKSIPMVRGGSEGSRSQHQQQQSSSSSQQQQHHLPPPQRPRARSRSGSQPTLSRPRSTHGHVRGGHRLKRSGSGSSTSSARSTSVYPSGSSSNLLGMVQLPSSKWRFLKHLSLADNGLTNISANSLTPLANTLHSLDLSSNLLAQVPDALAMLTCLRALNLSNCMIDSLRSLTRNPLPAITALNLRSNRLISLAGIERLPALERLDLRDNRMVDPMELARLTGIPDLREIWVADNPFTRTHPHYRVTIFNLFRSAQGYTEDLTIDASGPGYAERRQLVERVVQSTPAPPAPIESPSGDIEIPPSPSPTSAVPALPADEPPTQVLPPDASPVRRANGPDSSPNPFYPNHSRSSRRRKGPRRRIVELSRSDIQSPSTELSFSSSSHDRGYHVVTQSEDLTSHAHRHAIASAPASPPALDGLHLQDSQAPMIHQVETNLPPPPSSLQQRPPLHRASTTSMGRDHNNADWDLSSELYRQKIEALRSEVGNGWLSVLSEGGWEHPQGIAHPMPPPPETYPSAASAIRSDPATPSAGPPTLVGGGRVLG